MNRSEMGQYHKNLAALLMSEPDRVARRPYLAEERKTPEYQSAKREAIIRNHPEDLPPLVQTIIWAQNILEKYSNLPKGNHAERKKAKAFLETTSDYLLQNPQEIDAAVYVWEGYNGSFYDLIKKESGAFIRKNWESITSDQLAEFVRIYADNTASGFAQALLTSYFKGPESRRQRIDAYYNFVSATLDLVGEDEAFKEGMKIALHATDILPKNPSLIEQTDLLSLPYGEVESFFKKLLVARCVVNQVRFIGSWDLDKYYEDRGNFIKTDSVAIEEGNKRQRYVIGKIGENKAKEMYYGMQYAMRLTSSGSIVSLSEERKQSLRMSWPFDLAFDETDPLNEKFKKVFPQFSSKK